MKHFVPDWIDEKIEKQILARNKRNGSGASVRYLYNMAKAKDVSMKKFSFDDMCDIVSTILDKEKEKYGFDSIIPKR